MIRKHYDPLKDEQTFEPLLHQKRHLTSRARDWEGLSRLSKFNLIHSRHYYRVLIMAKVERRIKHWQKYVVTATLIPCPSNENPKLLWKVIFKFVKKATHTKHVIQKVHSQIHTVSIQRLVYKYSRGFIIV